MRWHKWGACPKVGCCAWFSQNVMLALKWGQSSWEWKQVGTTLASCQQILCMKIMPWVCHFSHKASDRRLLLFYRSPKRLEPEDRADGPHCGVCDGRRGGVPALWQSSERWGSAVIPEHGAVNARGYDHRSGFVIVCHMEEVHLISLAGNSPPDMQMRSGGKLHITHSFLFVSSGILWVFFFSLSVPTHPTFIRLVYLIPSLLFSSFFSPISFSMYVSLSCALSLSLVLRLPLCISLFLPTHQIVSSGSAKLFDDTVEPESLPV